MKRIRLETSKGNGIDNYQGSEISQCERNWAASIPKDYPRAKPRTGMSPLYNCHGLTFASRRTTIDDPKEIQRIIAEDQWQEIPNIADVLPGDVVIYFSDDGEANHSGVVVTYDPEIKLPMICSKWGGAGEFIHEIDHCPRPPLYGPVKRFFRCQL